MTEEEIDEKLKTGMLAGRQWLLEQAQQREAKRQAGAAPQTLEELYTQNYLPSFRLYKFIMAQAERNPAIMETDGEWLGRIGKIYGTEPTDLD